MRALRWSLPLLCLVTAGPVWALSTVGNAYYQINVSDQSYGSSFGSWNAVTGAEHPAGADLDLLYDGTTTDTNYSTLRVYSSSGPRDYAIDQYAATHGGGVALDSYRESEGPSPLAESGQGWRVVWEVGPESLRIVQDVLAVGETFATAAIYHTVEITNLGTAEVALGWRNLYDWAVNDPAFDDGPSNRVETAAGAPVVGTTTREFLHTPAPGELVRVSVDRTTEDPPEELTPTYQPLLGLGFDPGFRPDLPVTLPDAYAFVSWETAFDALFDYAVDPDLDATVDTAGLSWFGPTAATAYTLSPGGSVRFTQALFGAMPSAGPGQTSPVPEPSTLVLLGTGLAALGLRARGRG